MPSLDPSLYEDVIERGSLKENGWFIDKNLCDLGMCFPRIVSRSMDSYSKNLNAYHGQMYLQLFNGFRYGHRVPIIQLHKTITIPSNVNKLILYFIGMTDDTGNGNVRFYLLDKFGKKIKDSGWIKSTVKHSSNDFK